MENWKERLWEPIKRLNKSKQSSNEAARAALLEVLQIAKSVKVSQKTVCRSASRNKYFRPCDFGGICVTHLYLVDKGLKRKDYALACHELEDVLYLSQLEHIGILANIIRVLEAGLCEAENKSG